MEPVKHIDLSNDSPEISIVVPAYNAEKYVAKTLDSLLKQHFANFEIIIVNDGSTDGTKAVIEKFFFDRRIRYFEKENGGTGSALNVGHEHARGKYVTWCSADNIYFPDFLLTLHAALSRAPEECGLVYADFIFINAQDRQIGRPILHDKPQSGKELVNGYDIGMAFLYKKTLWDKTGPYWNEICEDFDWCVRAAQHAKFGLVKKILAAHRMHGNQITGSAPKKELEVADKCKALARRFMEEGRYDF